MVNVKPVKLGNNIRQSFAKIDEVIEMPNLIEVQKSHMTGLSKRDLQRYSRMFQE